ncbi:MAG: coproporphyrinogen-III oxidase family protein [Coriobacteriales bacterium]|nr:coproporphyrinogen-III oxidase family protein [Coriobacteriales bacterium]
MAVGALYLHIPFCARKCAYCDFASWPCGRQDPLMSAYAHGLAELAREVASAGLLEPCATAYIGGGTPTLLGARTLGELLSCVRELAPNIRELSCEANPDSLSDEVLESLRLKGATRVSVGVQSLLDAELEALGRLHSAGQACERVRAAVATGLDVSADLMCATPRQTDASWEHTLTTLLALGPQHVSVYPLMLEQGTPLGERYAESYPAWNDEDVEAARMEQAARVLEAAGFARYEVASYAKPHKRCAHNIAYWTGVSYLGLGTAAASMLDRASYERLRASCPQLPRLPEDVVRVRLTIQNAPKELAQSHRLRDLAFEGELLDARQARAEDLMLGMRLTNGVDETLWKTVPEPLAHDLSDRGLVCNNGGRVCPTRRGWLLGNELYGALWELAGAPVRPLAPQTKNPM